MGTPSHAALITEQQERTAARRTPGAVDPLLSVWTCQQRPRQSPMFAVRVSARKCMQQLHSWETSLNKGGLLAPSKPYHCQTIRSLPHHASPPAQQSIHMTPPPPYPFLPHTSPEQLTAQASSETSRKVATLPALQERKHICQSACSATEETRAWCCCEVSTPKVVPVEGSESHVKGTGTAHNRNRVFSPSYTTCDSPTPQKYWLGHTVRQISKIKCSRLK